MSERGRSGAGEAQSAGPVVDEAPYAAAIASLTRCTPPRLIALARAGPLDETWHAIIRGRVAALPGVGPVLRDATVPLAARWHAEAQRIDVAALGSLLTATGTTVLVVDRPGFPAVLAADPEPPGVLFVRGDPGALDRPRVAIVGTRRCTHYGREVAASLGRDLSASGIAVVSGLALGIDGAAHEGALAAEGDAAAAPIGVVGSGIDVVYPRSHRTLWSRVADRGLLMTEAPMGAKADPWRFPLRNRILAGLAHVVVVVESHAAGGSMITVRAALDRGVPVMAVPGSVRSPSSAGTNRLLSEGMPPVLDVDDVLVALSLEGLVPAPAGPEASGDGADPDRRRDHRPEVEGDEAAVLVAVDWTATSTEDIVRRTGLGVGVVVTVLNSLELRGLVRHRGSWWERT